VDLTRKAEPGAPPEEVLALQYEYTNMQSWDLAYDLFAERTEGSVSEELYTRVNTDDVPSTITEYSFPSVEVQGDNASIERINTTSSEGEASQTSATQEAVLEDGAWRILMRDDQIEFYTNWTPPEETTG